MSFVSVPKLAELIGDPSKVAIIPPEAIPHMLGELEKLRAGLWARLTLSHCNGKSGNPANEDRLLDAKEAAAKLHTSTDYIYRHASKLPFTVRIGRQIRFSEAGIARYIRQRIEH